MNLYTDDISFWYAQLGEQWANVDGTHYHDAYFNLLNHAPEFAEGTPIIAGHMANYATLQAAIVASGVLYRECRIFLHAHAFGLPRSQVYNLVVFYLPDLIFNIETPNCRTWEDLPCVYDAIWDLRNEQPERYDGHWLRPSTVFPTPEVVKPWLPRLATGWTLRNAIEWSEDKSQEEKDAVASEANPALQHMLRLAWCTGCQPISANSALWVHPWHHRRLSLGELARLCGFWAEPISGAYNDVLGDDVGMALWYMTNCLPTPIAEWLMRQFELCLSGAWGTSDWQARYIASAVDVRKDGIWDTQDATGQSSKEMHLYDWRAMKYDLERFEQEARSQFHNWVDIKNR